MHIHRPQSLSFYSPLGAFVPKDGFLIPQHESEQFSTESHALGAVTTPSGGKQYIGIVIIVR